MFPEKILKTYGDLGGELHLVEVERGRNGLGLSLAGNRDLSVMSIFVVGIHPESPVGRDGRIRVGDELLEVGLEVKILFHRGMWFKSWFVVQFLVERHNSCPRQYASKDRASLVQIFMHFSMVNVTC